MMKRTILITLFLFFSGLQLGLAQYFEWSKILHDTASHSESGKLVYELPNHDYLIASDGQYFNKTDVFLWTTLYKTNSHRDSLFSVSSYKKINFSTGSTPYYIQSQNIGTLSNGDYIIYSAIIDSGFIKLGRFVCDSNGKNSFGLNTKYRVKGLDSITQGPMNVKYIPEKGFYLYGSTYSNSYVIWKLDTSGKLVWRQDYYDTCNARYYNLNFIGNKMLLTSGIYNSRMWGFRLLWMDNMGIVLKEGTVVCPSTSTNLFYLDRVQNHVNVLSDSNIIVGFDGYQDNSKWWSNYSFPLLLKFNTNLDTVWHRFITVPRNPNLIHPNNDFTKINKIVLTIDSNIAIGWQKNFYDYATLGGNLLLRQLDYKGAEKSEIVLDSVVKSPPFLYDYNDMIATSDKGFAFVSSTNIINFPKYSTWLIKLSNHLITSIETINQSRSNISLFPNPANEAINIKSLENIYSLTLFNIQGNEIQEKININKKEFIISRNNVPNGIYLLKIISSNGQMQTLKFIWR